MIVKCVCIAVCYQITWMTSIIVPRKQLKVIWSWFLSLVYAVTVYTSVCPGNTWMLPVERENLYNLFHTFPVYSPNASLFEQTRPTAKGTPGRTLILIPKLAFTAGTPLNRRLADTSPWHTMVKPGGIVSYRCTTFAPVLWRRDRSCRKIQGDILDLPAINTLVSLPSESRLF